VSEQQILDSLSVLSAEMKTTACITDIASVKSRIAAAVARVGSGPGYLSIHPMFGPVDRIVGLNIITVRLRENPATRALEETLASWNVHLSYLTADEHDLVAAYVQVLPHAMLLAFGDTLVRCGKDLSTLRSAGTPVHTLMMILLSRIITNASTAYWSIQVHNPYAARVRREVQDALHKMDQLSEAEQEAGFNRLLSGISELLLPDLPRLREQSSRLLDIVCAAASKEFDPVAADTRRNRPGTRGSMRADRID
jgi:prephenate dehydrogenase